MRETKLVELKDGETPSPLQRKLASKAKRRAREKLLRGYSSGEETEKVSEAVFTEFFDDDTARVFEENAAVSTIKKYEIDRDWFLNQTKKRCLTGSQLAALLNLHPVQWSQVLHGRRTPTFREALALSSLFNTAVEDIALKLGIPAIKLPRSRSNAFVEKIDRIDESAVGVNITGLIEATDAVHYFRTTVWVKNPTRISDVFALQFSQKHFCSNAVGFFLESYRVRDLRLEKRLGILKLTNGGCRFGFIQRIKSSGMYDRIMFRPFKAGGEDRFTRAEVESIHPLAWLYIPKGDETTPDDGYGVQDANADLEDLLK